MPGEDYFCCSELYVDCSSLCGVRPPGYQPLPWIIVNVSMFIIGLLVQLIIRQVYQRNFMCAIPDIIRRYSLIVNVYVFRNIYIYVWNKNIRKEAMNLNMRKEIQACLEGWKWRGNPSINTPLLIFKFIDSFFRKLLLWYTYIYIYKTYNQF